MRAQDATIERAIRRTEEYILYTLLRSGVPEPAHEDGATRAEMLTAELAHLKTMREVLYGWK
jgi:hypothetical protein